MIIIRAMAQFFCKTEKSNDVFIVRAEGYLDEVAGQMIRTAIEGAFEKGVLKFVLNFFNSPVINSPGVAQIIEIVEIMVEERNCRVAYVGLTELTRSLFKMVGLMKLGKDFPDEATALKSF